MQANTNTDYSIITVVTLTTLVCKLILNTNYSIITIATLTTLVCKLILTLTILLIITVVIPTSLVSKPVPTNTNYSIYYYNSDTNHPSMQANTNTITVPLLQ